MLERALIYARTDNKLCTMKNDCCVIHDFSAFGVLRLEFRRGALAVCRLVAAPSAAHAAPPCPEAESAIRELAEYFAGTRKTFSVRIDAEGTPFQLAVWTTLRRIPYGEVRTYGEVARMIGHPQAVRAVGGACHANPCMIFTPCHRVVAAHGPGGFGGGMETKRRLLALETGSETPFGFAW